PEEKKLGINGSSTATLILQDVRISEENRLGNIGKGHHIALNILNLARLKLAFANIGTSKQALSIAVNYGKERKQFQQAIDNIGTSKQALSIAVNYGKERKQFQQAIVDFTMTQEKLANMAIAIYGAESTAYYTAGLLDQMDALLENEGDV